MKKFLIVLGILAVLVAAAVIAFILTFNPAQYAPMVESRLEQTLDAEVSFDDIRLSWDGGIGLQVKNLLIADRQPQSQDLPIQIEKLKLLLKIGPLLRRSIQIGSVEIIRPAIHATRTADGVLFIGGLRSLSEKKSPASNSAGLTFLIETLGVKEGTFYFHDLKNTEPVHLQFKNLDAQIKNFSLLQPLRFVLRGGLFGDENFSAKGQVTLPTREVKAGLQDMILDFDLSKLNFDELRVSIPTLTSLPLTSAKGNVHLEVPTLILSEAGQNNIQASLNLDNAYAELNNLAKPVSNLNADVTIHGGTLNIQNIGFKLGEASISGRGEISNWIMQPLTSFELTAEHLKPEDFVAHEASSAYLRGIISANFKGGSTAPKWSQFTDFLYGEGLLTLEDGVLVNVNVMQSIFQKISIIPGLMNKLQQNLPEDVRERLNAPHTELAPITQKFNVQNKMLYADQIQLQSQDYVVFGTFQYQFDQMLRAQASFEISPEISKVFIASVKELGTLANQEGRIQIPVNIYGRVPNVAIFPDLQYIGSKLAVVTAQEFIGNLIQKKNAPTATDPANPQTSSTSQPQPQNSLGGLLSGFLQPARTQDTVQSQTPTSQNSTASSRKNTGSLLSELLSSTLQQKAQQSNTNQSQ